MADKQAPELVGSCEINGEVYNLARSQNKRSWQQQLLDEPPYAEASPNLLSDPQYTWHNGGFKSRQGITGTSEYGKNTDCRFPFKVLPGPLVSTITLTGSAHPPTSIFEALGYIFVVAGRRVFRIDPTNDAVVESKDFGSDICVMGAKWENDLGFVTTSEAVGTANLWMVSAIGAPDTWTAAPSSVSRGTVVSGLNNTTNPVTFPCSDSSSIRVGDTLVAESEHLYVSATAAIDSACNLNKNITAQSTDVNLSVDTNTIIVGEIIQMGAAGVEKMLVTAISGDVLTVTRGYAGTTITAYNQPQDVYVYRNLTVTRGVDDTAIASHANGTALSKTIEGANAYRIAAGINRLFKVDKQGTLRNITSGLDPQLEDNWADSVQCGDLSTAPTSLIAYDKTAFVGKPEGMFGVDQDGFGVPLIKRMARDSDNCRAMRIYEPYVLVNHSRGLYRYIPGTVESVGLEQELLNESPVRGQWQDFAFDGYNIYGLLLAGSDTYICIGRERKGNEPGFGPIIWDTWPFLSGTSSKTIHLSELPTNPTLYFGYGNNLAKIVLTTGGGTPDPFGSGYAFATSTIERYFPKVKFDDWNSKDFPKVSFVARGVDATHYWTAGYSVDGGAFSSLDINGATMEMKSAGLFTFVLPTSAVGREIQFRVVGTNPSTGLAIEIDYIEPFASPQPKKSVSIVAQLWLKPGLRDFGQDERASIDQFNALLALARSASTVLTTGPWGESIRVMVKRVTLVEALDSGRAEPELLCEVLMQIRADS